MDNSKFKALIECIEKGSVTAAADSLGYTPSAVSQLISSLEKELGLKLLTRSQKGVGLTAEGSELLPAIRACLASEEEVYHIASDLRGLASGKLTIAAYPSVAITWLPGIIRRFRSDYPGIQINVKESIKSDVVERFEKNEADLAILAYSEPMPYEWIDLADEAVIAALPEDHPYANARAFPIKEVENYDLIIGSWGNEKEILDVLEKHDLHPEIKYTTYDTPATMAMVRMGLGMSLVNELSAQYWNDNLVKLPLDPPETTRFGVAMPSRKKLSNAAKKFLGYVMEEFGLTYQ